MFRPIIRKSRIAREDDNQLQGNDDKTDVVPPTVDDAMVVDTSFIDDSLQEASIAREEAELEQLEGDIAVAEVSRDRLERVKEGLEKTIENGGMTPIEADMAELATDQALTDIGIDGDEPVIPATEEYLTDPLQATRLAIESLSDKIKHVGNVIWAGIIKFFKKMAGIFKIVADKFRKLDYASLLERASKATGSIDLNDGSERNKHGYAVICKVANGHLELDRTAFRGDMKKLMRIYNGAVLALQDTVHTYSPNNEGISTDVLVNTFDDFRKNVGNEGEIETNGNFRYRYKIAAIDLLDTNGPRIDGVSEFHLETGYGEKLDYHNSTYTLPFKDKTILDKDFFKDYKDIVKMIDVFVSDKVGQDMLKMAEDLTYGSRKDQDSEKNNAKIIRKANRLIGGLLMPVFRCLDDGLGQYIWLGKRLAEA